MGFQCGLSGMNAASKNLDVIGNNIANANTVGMKSSRAEFADLVASQLGTGGGAGAGIGVAVATVAQQFTQGSVNITGNSLDVAIDGRGFFQVRQPDGSAAYTRDGNFEVDSQGQLVTASGNVVEPGITIPQGTQSVTIGSDGTVTAQLPGQATPAQIGTLQLTDFVNAAGLMPKGENLYVETAASGTPQTGTPGQNGIGTLAQGALEGSNVNVVEELVNMIETQRAYEMNSKAISASDQMLQYLNNNV